VVHELKFYDAVSDAVNDAVTFLKCFVIFTYGGGGYIKKASGYPEALICSRR
jgi:hypothetical protein